MAFKPKTNATDPTKVPLTFELEGLTEEGRDLLLNLLQDFRRITMFDHRPAEGLLICYVNVSDIKRKRLIDRFIDALVDDIFQGLQGRIKKLAPVAEATTTQRSCSSKPPQTISRNKPPQTIKRSFAKPR